MWKGPKDEPLIWAGEWEPMRFSREQVEQPIFLTTQIRNMLTRRSIDHSQSGIFSPKSRKSLALKLMHAQDVRPNAMAIYSQWPDFLPGTPRLDIAINIQRAFESVMYVESDWEEWPVICRLLGTGVPRADQGRKQRCPPQVAFLVGDALWVYRYKDDRMRSLTWMD